VHVCTNGTREKADAMTITVREARPGDEPAIAELIHLLAAAPDELSGVSADYVPEYLGHDGAGALLAETGGKVVGLLTYKLSPDLYHGGPSGLLDDLVVRPEARRRGVADALVSEALRRFEVARCKEASVSTEFDNEPAKALYRKHGLCEESLLLERHF